LFTQGEFVEIQVSVMKIAALLLLSLLAGGLHAAFPTLHLRPLVLQQLVSPVGFAHAGDGSKRLFICEQSGTIRIVQHGMLLPVPFLDLTPRVLPLNPSGADERGLLGLAFHPQYDQPGQPGHRRFYVYYSRAFIPGNDPVPPTWAIQPNHVSVLAEYQASVTQPNLADPGSERILLTFAQPQANHNGGQLEFGPDGSLYLSTGDGGSSDDNQNGHTGGGTGRPANALGNAQDLSNLLGKILRLDPLGTDGPGGAYGIPAGNPFVGVSGARAEIYAFGLRNPWRFSFDDVGDGATNRLFCADVGQGRIEEISLIEAGRNYGWRRFEGTFDLFPLTPNPSAVTPTAPIAAYAHPGEGAATGLPEFGISVTGGYVYRGSTFPALQGKYVFADYSASNSAPSGVLLGIEETSPGVFGPVTALQLSGGSPLATRILAMGRDEDGELYLATKVARGATALGVDNLPSGAIYQIQPLQIASMTFTAVKDTSLFQESNNSSAKGETFFTGKIGVPNDETPPGSLRRGLVAFNLGAFPANTAPLSASLSLYLDAVGSFGLSFPVALHRATEDWGEGTSNAGRKGGTGAAPTAQDATWNHRFYSGSLWSTPGGSFAITASATSTVTGAGKTYAWSGAGLLTDVQAWLDAPASNFGWFVRGDETTEYSAMRFASREWTTASQRPRLTLTYPELPPPTRWQSWLEQHFPGRQVGSFFDEGADQDGDGLNNGFEYAYGLEPGTTNAVSVLDVSREAGTGGGIDHVYRFRRDTQAVDLEYLLETSADLTTWTTIVRSSAGAAPVATSGAQVEQDEVLDGTIHQVQVRVGAPADERRFARMRLVRLSQ
jgi:glucose/arabinose dehydrogenase